MNVRYVVELSENEREQLRTLTGGGKAPVRKVKRAQVLLAADAGVPDEAIARSVGVGTATVYRIKRRFVEGNLERALAEEPRPGASRKLTGKEEEPLVATACSSPPQGRARWTLQLLAGAMVELIEHDTLSRETVRRRLAENDLKPWRKEMWCIPKVDAEYVALQQDLRLGLLTPSVARELGRLPCAEQLRAAEDPAERRAILADPGRVMSATLARAPQRTSDSRLSAGGNQLRQSLLFFEGAAARLASRLLSHATEDLGGEASRLPALAARGGVAPGRSAQAPAGRPSSCSCDASGEPLHDPERRPGPGLRSPRPAATVRHADGFDYAPEAERELPAFVRKELEAFLDCGDLHQADRRRALPSVRP